MTAAYTIFVDESFDGYMNLSRDDGYFCYAALMVPTERLEDLARFWASNRARLATAYAKETGFPVEGEFKSGYLKKLRPETRTRFGEKLAYFLSKNGCFVVGYFTTVRNTLLYRLRTDVAKDDNARELPSDWEQLLVSEKSKLLGDKPNHPGDAHVLLGLLYQTLAITMSWLASQRQTFAVVYDPRQKKEDRYLLNQMDDWLQRASAATNSGDVYMGATATTDSADSPGLMLVDLILRDIRFLFQDVPELLAEQSGPALILPLVGEHEPVPMEIHGNLMKWGDRRPMSEALRRRLSRPTTNSCAPLYFSSLADGKLSCEADFGESRVVNLRQLVFEDQVD